MGAATLATIRALRDEKHWTQEDLARQSGLTWATVSRIERGEVSPNIRTAQAIADALGVTLNDIDWPKQAKGGGDHAGTSE